jgi:uncharacterized protein YegP (UPF0339 family)
MRNILAQKLKKGIRVWKGADGQFYFSIIGPNGQVIAVSEGYTRKWSAWRGAFAAKKALSKNL